MLLHSLLALEGARIQRTACIAGAPQEGLARALLLSLAHLANSCTYHSQRLPVYDPELAQAKARVDLQRMLDGVFVWSLRTSCRTRRLRLGLTTACNARFQFKLLNSAALAQVCREHCIDLAICVLQAKKVELLCPLPVGLPNRVAVFCIQQYSACP